MRNTLVVDKNNNKNEAIMDIYRLLRPGEPPTLETSQNLFNNLFFNKTRYDLSDVGRVKLNSRLEIDCDPAITVLRKEDILKIVETMLKLNTKYQIPKSIYYTVLLFYYNTIRM